MSKTICLEFKNLLSRYFGKIKCMEVEDCPSLKQVLFKLAIEHRVPINHEFLFFAVDGKYIDPETSVCSINAQKISVYYTYIGG